MSTFFQDLYAIIWHNSYSCPPTCLRGRPLVSHLLLRLPWLLLSWKLFPTKYSRWLLLFYTLEIVIMEFVVLIFLFLFEGFPGEIIVICLIQGALDVYLRSKFFNQNKTAPIWSWQYFAVLMGGILLSLGILVWISRLLF